MNPEGAAMTDCPFCQRINASEYDDGNRFAVTFEPVNPVTPGHRLVVSRRHVAHALADPFAAAAVMEYAAEVAFRYKAGSCNLITSAGADATQTVFHLHMHIVPRWPGDGLALPWTGQERLEGSGD